MHIYRKASLTNRSKMNRGVGFWLDYWLFLNADDAHPLWASRPMGLQQLAHDCLQCTEKSFKSMRIALAGELESVAALVSILQTLPSPPESLGEAKDGWSANWIVWFEKVRALPRRAVIESFVEALAWAISANDFRKIAFLSRRFSAEISSTEDYRRTLYAPIDRQFAIEATFARYEFDRNSFATTLLQIIAPPKAESFEVVVPLAPLRTSKRALKVLAVDQVLDYELTTEGHITLKGCKFIVSAPTAADAAGVAIEKARSLLQTLRLSANIHTHIWGTIVCTELKSQIITNVQPPQPFWDRTSGAAKTPRLPIYFKQIQAALPRQERQRWTAATWHMAQAFKVWQALETFSAPSGKAFANVSANVPIFIEQSISDLAETLGKEMLTQRSYFREDEIFTDWRMRPQEKSISDWFSLIYNRNSPTHYSKWWQPWVPDLICNYDVGLLNQINTALFRGEPAPWMPERLRRDLTLLYSLRNLVVHTGQPLLSRAMASYLARLGLQILFTMMQHRAMQLRAHQ
jgi:hypothetical protein